MPKLSELLLTSQDTNPTSDDAIPTLKEVGGEATNKMAQLKDLPISDATKAYVDGLTPIYGSGFPNGVVSASPGRIYIDTNATNGASSWIKKSGTGNTGWQVLEGDTGWRVITSLYSDITAGSLKVKRVAGLTIYQFVDTRFGNLVGVDPAYTLPIGFVSSNYSANVFAGLNSGQVRRIRISPISMLIYGLTSADVINAQFSVDTTTGWPVTLP